MIRTLIFALLVLIASGSLAAQKTAWQPSPGHLVETWIKTLRMLPD